MPGGLSFFRYDANMRLNRVMFFVADLDRMIEFYGNTLGLTLIQETRLPNWAEFDTGAAVFSLHAIPSEVTAQIQISTCPREMNPIKLSFEVDDLAATRERLESRGATVIGRAWGAFDAIDPEGNIFGIYSGKE